MDPDPLPLISSILVVPNDIVTKRVRNVREAELLRETAATASRFESAVSTYEVLALKLAALKERWDSLWLSNEPHLAADIQLVGQAMSDQNVARGRLIEDIEGLVTSLQQQGAALLQFADMHRSYARELTAEGLGKLAAEKMLVCNIEQELASRITTICSGSGVRALCPMAEFVHRLESPSEQPAAGTASTTAPNSRKEPDADVPKHLLGKEHGSTLAEGEEVGKKNGGGEAVSGLGYAGSEGTGVRSNRTDPERCVQTEPNAGIDITDREAQLAAGAPLEPPQEKVCAGEEDEAGLRVKEPGTHSEAPRLGKRVREVGVEQGASKVPRLEGNPSGKMAASTDWVEPPRTGQQLSAAAPFSSNLAAAFQLEAGLDGSGSKSTRDSDEASARDRGPDSGGVGEKMRALDEEGLSEGGSESLEGHKRDSPPDGRGSQSEKDPALSSLERQLLTDEKLTPPSSSSPLTSTQSPRGPGESTPGSSNGFAGPGRQAAIDGSPGKRPLRCSADERSPSEEKARLEVGEKLRTYAGIKEDEKVPGSTPPQYPVEPVQVATPSATSRGDSPSQTRSPSKSQGGLGGSQNTPQPSTSPEKFENHRILFRSPSQGAAFQLRLSSSSSSPSKTPGSEKLSQTVGPFDCLQTEPTRNGGPSNPHRLDGVIAEGYRGRRLTLFNANNELGSLDPPTAAGATVLGKDPLVESPPERGAENIEPRVAATSALEAPPSLQPASAAQVDNNEDSQTAKTLVGFSGVLHEKCDLDGKEKRLTLTVEAIEPYTGGVWAHEAQWRETQSQAFTDGQSQSLSGERLGDYAQDGDRVPDSEEGASLSSGRGFQPAPAPPPSSPTSSPDDLLGKQMGPERRTSVAPARPVSSLSDPSDRGTETSLGIGKVQVSDQHEQATPVDSQNAPDASQTKSDPSGSGSGATELVPETESMDEETEEQESGRDAATRQQETAPVASPCRASESPALMGSQPLSQSRVC